MELENRGNGESFAGLNAEAFDVKGFELGNHSVELEGNVELLGFFREN